MHYVYEVNDTLMTLMVYAFLINMVTSYFCFRRSYCYRIIYKLSVLLWVLFYDKCSVFFSPSLSNLRDQQWVLMGHSTFHDMNISCVPSWISLTYAQIH